MGTFPDLHHPSQPLSWRKVQGCLNLWLYPMAKLPSPTQKPSIWSLSHWFSMIIRVDPLNHTKSLIPTMVYGMEVHPLRQAGSPGRCSKICCSCPIEMANGSSWAQVFITTSGTCECHLISCEEGVTWQKFHRSSEIQKAPEWTRPSTNLECYFHVKFVFVGCPHLLFGTCVFFSSFPWMLICTLVG